MVSIILRNTQEEETEAYLKWLASKYHLSDEFVEKIKNEKMKLSEAKEMIREIKWKKAQEEKWKRLWSDEDIILWSEELKKLFWEQFDLTFFRKWVNMLRLGMMTITQAEQEEKIKYCEENWFEKNNQPNWTTEYRKWAEIIVIYLSSEILDKEERLLRDKIWISEWKEKLEQVRKSGNKEEIAQIELEASQSIIKILYEYMYQLTEKHNWYQPSKIREQKEIYCVWYSLLWHAFLSELWIEHYWLCMHNHSALEVVIWWGNYYFDVTLVDKILEFWYWKSIWVSNEIVWKWWSIWTPIIAQRWDPEKILFSQIYNNKWCALYESRENEETIEMFNKAIVLNPSVANFYNCKSGALYRLWRYEEAIENFDKAIELNPNFFNDYNCKWRCLCYLWRYEEAIEAYNKAIELDPINSHTYKNKWLALEKLWKQKLSKLYRYVSDLLEWKKSSIGIFYIMKQRKIDQFIGSKDFEWLRKYLIELEKEES